MFSIWTKHLIRILSELFSALDVYLGEVPCACEHSSTSLKKNIFCIVNKPVNCRNMYEWKESKNVILYEYGSVCIPAKMVTLHPWLLVSNFTHTRVHKYSCRIMRNISKEFYQGALTVIIFWLFLQGHHKKLKRAKNVTLKQTMHCRFLLVSIASYHQCIHPSLVTLLAFLEIKIWKWLFKNLIFKGKIPQPAAKKTSIKVLHAIPKPLTTTYLQPVHSTKRVSTTSN